MSSLRHSFLIAVVLLVCALVLVTPTAAVDEWNGDTATGFAAGSGTESDPYQIETGAQLAYLAQQVNGGTTYAGKYFILTDDIDLNGQNGQRWPGIGVFNKNGYSSDSKPFSGIFDGNEKKITGMTFANNTGASYAARDPNNYRGLFNQLVGATVIDLTVEGNGFGTNTPSGEYGGAMIAGHAWGSTIENCVAEGAIEGTHNVAGIVVRIKDAQIIDCTNKADLTGSYSKMGGIVCLSQDSQDGCFIDGCTNEGSITSTDGGKDGVGGIIGWIGYPSLGLPSTGSADEITVTITDCWNKGVIMANGESAVVGQIAGQPHHYWNVPDGNKGLSTQVAVGTTSPNALTFGIVSDESGEAFVTYISTPKAGNSYLVTAAGTKPVIELGSGESITFDTSLAALGDASGITAVLGLTVKAPATNGDKVTYTAETAAASIGDMHYLSLQGAIDASKDGEVIKVVSNVELDDGLEIATDDKLTIDLNGFTISYKSDETTGNAAITNRGDLTIIDSSAGQTGKITYTSVVPSSANAYATNTITNYGTLTIESGTIENNTNGGVSYVIDNNSTVGIATATINGGKVDGNGNTAIRQFCNSATFKNTVTINDGAVTGSRAIWLQLPGSTNDAAPDANLDINGGTLTATGESGGYKMAIYSYSYGNAYRGVDIKITDGVITGDVAIGGGSAKGGEGAEILEITGGTFTGESEVYTYNNKVEDNIAISGGTFAVAPAEEYLAENVALIKNADGTYGTFTNTLTCFSYTSVTNMVYADEKSSVMFPINFITDNSQVPEEWLLTVTVTDENRNDITADLNYDLTVASSYYDGWHDRYGFSSATSGKNQFVVMSGNTAASNNVDELFMITVSNLPVGEECSIAVEIITSVLQSGTGNAQVSPIITVDVMNTWLIGEMQSNIYSDVEGVTKPWNVDNNVWAELTVKNPGVDSYTSKESVNLTYRDSGKTFGLNISSSGTVTIKKVVGTETTDADVATTVTPSADGMIVLTVASGDKDADKFIIRFDGYKVGDVVTNGIQNDVVTPLDVKAILYARVNGPDYLQQGVQVYADVDKDGDIDTDDAEFVFIFVMVEDYDQTSILMTKGTTA